MFPVIKAKAKTFDKSPIIAPPSHLLVSTFLKIPTVYVGFEYQLLRKTSKKLADDLLRNGVKK